MHNIKALNDVIPHIMKKVKRNDFIGTTAR